ncbi:MAG: thiamine diphosphokinase, partial [Anaerotignum sp.]|nr:thiamine diphosphokinase [Anaerotignum sp.]
MKTVIFGGAPIREYGFCREHLKDADVIICCDAGMGHAKALGIDPDYIVGDFDSTTSDVLEYYKTKNIPIRQFPTRKDETDMELGIFLALELGATDIVMFGGIGDRFDHTLANAHYLLSLLKKGVRARLVDDKNCVEVIDKHLTVEGKVGDLVSTLPLSM